MEILGLIIAIAAVMITLTSSRLRIIFKIALSAISGYFLLKIFMFNDIYIYGYRKNIPFRI
jgi:hypothetical protein